MEIKVTDSKTGGKLINTCFEVPNDYCWEETKKDLEYLWQEDKRLRERCTGRTTRLADEYIQKLFENEGKWVFIRDHHDATIATYMLCNIIDKRINFEHPWRKCDMIRNGGEYRMRIIQKQ